MSENKVPPEFEWIKPGVKAIYNSKTHPKKGAVMEFLEYPKLRKPDMNPLYLPSWVVPVDWFGADNPEYCLNFDRVDQITLTLTREQADGIYDALNVLDSPALLEHMPELSELRIIIEEKLK